MTIIEDLGHSWKFQSLSTLGAVYVCSRCKMVDITDADKPDPCVWGDEFSGKPRRLDCDESAIELILLE